jgi:hypothetical protein
MTQSTFRIALASGFGAGLIGALLSGWLTGSEHGAGPASTSTTAQPSATETVEPPAGSWEPDAEWVMQLEQLREQVARLEAQMADSNRKPAEGYVTRTELDAALDQLGSADSGMEWGGALPTDDASFRQGLVEAVRTVEKERASKKLEADRLSRVERVDRDVASVGKLLDLTPSQEDNLRNALLVSYEREEQVLALWREGASDEMLGTVKQANDELLQSELGAFLTEEQLGMFNSLAVGGGK